MSDKNNLSHRIDKFKRKRLERKHKNNVAKGMSGGAEFVSSILVGCFLGYYMDKWLDTNPIFFLVGTLLGVAAGGLTIYKLSMKISSDEDSVPTSSDKNNNS